MFSTKLLPICFVRIHEELVFILKIYSNLTKLDDELRSEIREDYIFGKKTKISIHKIKNHRIWNCIYGEIKEQSKRKKIIHEERENDNFFRN